MAVADMTPLAPPQEVLLPLDSIIRGEALEVLRTLPDNSIDALVTDPPAGISFMGKTWDSDHGGRDQWIAAFAAIYRECLRVLKPGGHALVWALPRTSHWTAMALEDAGFEIRDRVSHLFGSGFPKSLDVSKAIDANLLHGGSNTRRLKRANEQSRHKVGERTEPDRNNGFKREYGALKTIPITAPATDAARAWDGWGTALKPAVEDWWLCRKPLSEKNIAANVLRWGTGALNIDGSRVPAPDGVPQREKRGERPLNTYSGGAGMNGSRSLGISSTQGRWPANLLLSHAPECGERGCSLWCPVRALDAQSGIRTSGLMTSSASRHKPSMYGQGNGQPTEHDTYGDTGGASRYFTTFAYVPKASRSERNRGCEGLPKTSQPIHNTAGRDLTNAKNIMSEGGRRRVERGETPTIPVGNYHPTVKPLALMSWLITLITPPGGIVLDCFAGSGSTLVAAKQGDWRFIGIEREAEYVQIIQARLAATRSAGSSQEGRSSSC